MGATTTPGQEHRGGHTQKPHEGQLRCDRHVATLAAVSIFRDRDLCHLHSALEGARIRTSIEGRRQAYVRVTQQHACTKLGGLILLQEREHTHVLSLSS